MSEKRQSPVEIGASFEKTLDELRGLVVALDEKRSTAYREGYEAGQKSAHSTPGDICRTCRTFGSVSCYPADVGRAIRALQEAAKRGESRADERKAWMDKCGALEDQLKVADKATAEAHAQRERAEAHFRATLAEVTRERDAALAAELRQAGHAEKMRCERCQAENERNVARSDLLALRERLAALVNGKA